MSVLTKNVDAYSAVIEQTRTQTDGRTAWEGWADENAERSRQMQIESMDARTSRNRQKAMLT